MNPKTPYKYLSRAAFFLLFFSTSMTTALAGPMPWEISKTLWTQISQLKGIPTNPKETGSISLYIFFDPNCPWCNQLWNAKVEGYVFSEIPAVWIPVDYLGDSSLGKAAAILHEGNVDALNENFGTSFLTKPHSGGIDPIKPTKYEIHELNEAKSTWRHLGGVTPLLVYRTSFGKTRIYLGFPKDKSVLRNIVHSLPPTKLKQYQPIRH